MMQSKSEWTPRALRMGAVRCMYALSGVRYPDAGAGVLAHPVLRESRALRSS